MTIALAMIPCSGNVAVSSRALKHSLATLFPKLARASAGEEGAAGDPVMFEIGRAHVGVAFVDATMPVSDLGRACETTRFWPEAAQALRDHAGHLVVSVGGELARIPTATLLTQVCAGVLDTTPSALGVYWVAATTLVRKDAFVSMARQMGSHGPPQSIWVDFRVASRAEGGSLGYTFGLSALGLLEFEAIDAPEPLAQLFDRLEALAARVLRHGPVIRTGDAVSRHESEKVGVMDAPSAFGNPARVLRLHFVEVPAVAPRPWWARLLGR